MCVIISVRLILFAKFLYPRLCDRCYANQSATISSVRRRCDLIVIFSRTDRDRTHTHTHTRRYRMIAVASKNTYTIACVFRFCADVKSPLPDGKNKTTDRHPLDWSLQSDQFPTTRDAKQSRFALTFSDEVSIESM